MAPCRKRARALTQFFFDNDDFARYLDHVRAAGITIPIVPGILPIQNLAQVKRFARLCGATVPGFVEDALAPFEEQPEERACLLYTSDAADEL